MEKVILDFSKLNFFDSEKEYLKLYAASLVSEEDIDNSDNSFDILKNTYNRYKTYLNNIEFTDDSKIIKFYIKQYLKLYDDYLSKEYTLFKLMEKIDSHILGMIHDSKTSRFWLN